MGGAPETTLNVRLASLMSDEFGIDCRTGGSGSGARPGIKCYYGGVRVSIEASYSARDAEMDAAVLVEEGLADIALAVHYRTRPPAAYVAEANSDDLLGELVLSVRLITPQRSDGLLEYLRSMLGVEISEDGWIENIGVGSLASIVRNAATYIILEAELGGEIKRIKRIIGEFVKAADGAKASRFVRQNIAHLLRRLYGPGVPEVEDPEVVFGQAALVLFISTVFFERMRHHYGLEPVDRYLSLHGPIGGLRVALEDMLKARSEPALRFAVELLKVMPPELDAQVGCIVEAASRVAGRPHLLARDLAGRIYHEITGDMAVRKGFATYYTEVPAASLLADLALRVALGLERGLSEVGRTEAAEILERMRDLKVADFACGSGTLLTTSLHNAIRIARTLCFLYDLECSDIERRLAEGGIYGLDALEYAVHLAAIGLALVCPAAAARGNLVAVRLGYAPDRGASLGSLELLDDGMGAAGLLSSDAGGKGEVIDGPPGIGVESGQGGLPHLYDVIVMNPPFTRPTGRVSREFKEGRRGFFGFIAERRAREAVLRRYGEIRRRVRRDLIDVATGLFSREPTIRGVLGPLSSYRLAVAHGLDPYYNIGQAGEGLLFLYLAYKRVKPGGVIAFVLPRNLLSGVSWFLARALLADRFHIEYVVVSSDSEGGYNFSENTSLSECLLIARRVEEHSPHDETVFVNLLKKPASVLEAIALSDELVRHGGGLIGLPSGARCYVRRVRRAEVLENLDNLNRLVSLPEPGLVELGLRILREGDLGVVDRRVPLVRLGEIVESIGVDSPMFHEHFRRVDAETSFPIVFSGRESVRSRMVVRPNSYAEPRTPRAPDVFRRFSGRVLIPDRIWLDTAHVVAAYSEVPVISNVFYVVRLRDASPGAEKALVYWLNTTWGLLSVLMSREETRGRWIRLKKAQWRLLPVPDLPNLDAATLNRVADRFEKVSALSLRRIPSQYPEKDLGVDRARLELDLGFIKSLYPDVDESEVVEKLSDIYRRMSVALKRWIG